MPVLPLDFLVQQFAMEAVEGFYGFENEEVWQRDGELNVRSGDYGAAVAVRGDLDVVGFGHAGYFLGGKQAAGTSKIWLQD